MTAKRVAVRKSGVLSADLDGTTMILNLGNRSYYTMAGVGPRVWELVQEPRDVAGLVDCIATEYNVEWERAEKDIRDFLADLDRNGLIDCEY
ncbi:MAG: PqqD family protein [Acidobacteria bacterium]|nr:PqqD family protein [Acidobacteriota bacterium]